MKNCMYFILFVLLAGCGINHKDYEQLTSEYNKIKTENDSIKQCNIDLENKNKYNQTLIKTLRDSISILSFPAEQRLVKINSLIDEQNYYGAKNEIAKLTKVFPESKEARQAQDLLKKINGLEEKKRLEEEKRKALGFKGIKVSSSCKIDYNKVEISNISVGNTFVFDSYGDRYFYRTADRGNKYISAVMRITSDSKDPKLPQPAVYSIVGDKMKYVGFFTVEFMRWEDYGTYLGNSHDFGNDFAKTSSIRFKIGTEVSEETTKKPYAIVLKKENKLTRNYERFNEPPVSYEGFVDYPYQLMLDDLISENSNYVVIKIANL